MQMILHPLNYKTGQKVFGAELTQVLTYVSPLIALPSTHKTLEGRFRGVWHPS